MAVFVALIFIVAAIPLLLLVRAKIKITICRDTRVEITFTLITVELSDFGDGGSKKTPFSIKRRIFKRIISLVERSEVSVEELRLSRGAERDFAPASYTAPYRYHIAISALLAYIKGKAQKLNIDDNAIILVPDRDEHFSLILTLRARLFHVLTNAWGIYRDTKETEKKGRKKKYVGN